MLPCEVRCRLRVGDLRKLMSSMIRGPFRLDVIYKVMLLVDISSGDMTWALVSRRPRATLHEGECHVRPLR